MDISSKLITKSATVSMPVKKAWWKWTTHEGLKTFFGLDNRIELRLNGMFEIYFLLENPDGLKGSEGCKILSYLPERMISFTWNAPPQFMDIRNHEYQTWVVVEFSELTKNKTKVTLSHTGWPEGEDFNPVYEYFENAWTVVMESFAESQNN